MSKRLRILVVLVLIAAAIGAGLLFQRQGVDTGRSTAAAAPAPAPRAVPVVLAAVETHDVPLRLRAVGRVEAYSTVTLRSRVDGQVLTVGYQAGQHVTRGQVMATLDSRALQAQVAQAEAAVARDNAQYLKARSDVERYAGLVAKGFVSAAQLEAYRATAAQLEATMQASQAALELARTQLSYTTVRAPIDGVAGAVLTQPGNIVRANDTSLVVINQVQPIYATFSVPESQLPEVRASLDRAATVPVIARVPGASATDAERRGELAFIDNAVDPATGTIQLKARFANKDEMLTPGQFVEVTLTLRTLDDVLTVPAEAVQTGPDGSFVWVARPDRTVEMRKVRTLSVGESRLVVQQGLADGERVVTDGQLRLVPGARYEARDARTDPREGQAAPRDAQAAPQNPQPAPHNVRGMPTEARPGVRS